ncbi:YEATS-associated helix-containing protein [Flavobacterium sp. 3HN19-14]|uniref:YEATS-associated helix-containing protein n=1 Tax=Flavobacterium sp. 3HN19-14 TaxID=3448133 RepID=UPI003EE399BA
MSKKNLNIENMSHEGILATIIICVGTFAGLANYMYYYYLGFAQRSWEFLKHIFSSIGAAILVPLLLNMLSSDLIKSSATYNNTNYFVFAGFCFVAGYFSDKFINTIGDKILKDIENTKIKVDKALTEVKETEEKVDFLVTNETDKGGSEENELEINIENFKDLNQFKDEDFNTQLSNIAKSFEGKYKFRTVEGIAKELKYTPRIVKLILEALEKEGAVKRLVDKDNKNIWGLTNIGRLLAKAK